MVLHCFISLFGALCSGFVNGSSVHYLCVEYHSTLCDEHSAGSVRCTTAVGCTGAGVPNWINACYPQYIWTHKPDATGGVYFALYNSIFGGQACAGALCTVTPAFSVRPLTFVCCVLVFWSWLTFPFSTCIGFGFEDSFYSFIIFVSKFNCCLM